MDGGGGGGLGGIFEDRAMVGRPETGGRQRSLGEEAMELLTASRYNGCIIVFHCLTAISCVGAQEQSFKEFLNRPENRPKVEAYQRSEIKKNLKMTEKMRTVEFRDKVSGNIGGDLLQHGSLLLGRSPAVV